MFSNRHFLIIQILDFKNLKSIFLSFLNRKMNIIII